ncbi:unnamed protein product [Sphagnum jensenii]|uniref:Uncharacterized protein n=1 Tax=Sphagnum jensenii TaxID=128206 RepID=A0ABP1B449_9BRYO
MTVLRKKLLDIGLDPGLRHPATPQAYVSDNSTLLRCTRCWHPPGNHCYQKEQRRAEGQFVNAWFMTVLRKKLLDIGLDPGLRHPATPQAYVSDKSTLLRRSRDQHPKGISIEYADLMHF